MDDILEDEEMIQMSKTYPTQFGEAKDKVGRPGNKIKLH
jgi:hypothetical protein